MPGTFLAESMDSSGRIAVEDGYSLGDTMTNRAFQWMKKLGHAATLLFCAYWLIATSAPNVPARDCFTGIGAKDTLRVVLGGPDSSQTPQVPSCQGLDGLVNDAALTFTLSQGPRSESAGCYGYETQSIVGTSDVTLAAAGPSSVWSNALTTVDGAFSSSRSSGCRGTWSIILEPDFELGSDQKVSPLDASSAERWTVVRSMDVAQAQFCDGVFSQTGNLQCQDRFLVQSITAVTP